MSKSTCINLEERFGARYRVRFEANGTTKPRWDREDWPWLMEIHGRYGMVYPQGSDILQAMTKRRRIGAQLRALPCVLTARGERETVITFHIDDAPAVFQLIKPYRRRQVSAAERERLATLSTRFGFGAQHISERDFPAAESTNVVSDGAAAVILRTTPQRSRNSTRRRRSPRGDD